MFFMKAGEVLDALIDLLVLARADALVAFDFSTYGDLAAIIANTTPFVVDGAGCSPRPMLIRHSVLKFVLETLHLGAFKWQVEHCIKHFASQLSRPSFDDR